MFYSLNPIFWQTQSQPVSCILCCLNLHKRTTVSIQSIMFSTKYHIFWFEIPVYDTLAMEILQCTNRTGNIESSCRIIKTTFIKQNNIMKVIQYLSFIHPMKEKQLNTYLSTENERLDNDTFIHGKWDINNDTLIYGKLIHSLMYTFTTPSTFISKNRPKFTSEGSLHHQVNIFSVLECLQ